MRKILSIGILGVAAAVLLASGCYVSPRPVVYTPPPPAPPAPPPAQAPAVYVETAPPPPAYTPNMVWYYGVHPFPPGYGLHRFCYISGPHSHDFAPYYNQIYRYYDGYYYWVGDPSPYGYRYSVWAYYGPHPLPHYWGGWCYIHGYHHHHYAPPPGHVHRYQRRSGTYYYTGRYDQRYNDSRREYDSHGRNRNHNRDHGYDDHRGGQRTGGSREGGGGYQGGGGGHDGGGHGGYDDGHGGYDDGHGNNGHGNDHGNGHGNDHGNNGHGNDHGNGHGNDHGNNGHDNDHGNSGRGNDDRDHGGGHKGGHGDAATSDPGAGRDVRLNDRSQFDKAMPDRSRDPRVAPDDRKSAPPVRDRSDVDRNDRNRAPGNQRGIPGDRKGDPDRSGAKRPNDKAVKPAGRTQPKKDERKGRDDKRDDERKKPKRMRR